MGLTFLWPAFSHSPDPQLFYYTVFCADSSNQTVHFYTLKDLKTCFYFQRSSTDGSRVWFYSPKPVLFSRLTFMKNVASWPLFPKVHPPKDRQQIFFSVPKPLSLPPGLIPPLRCGRSRLTGGLESPMDSSVRFFFV